MPSSDKNPTPIPDQTTILGEDGSTSQSDTNPSFKTSETNSEGKLGTASDNSAQKPLTSAKEVDFSELVYNDEKFKRIEKRVDALSDDNKSLLASYQSLSNDRSTFLVVFGVFASLVAFFSVEFQLLRSVSNAISFAGISTLLLSSLLLFNLFFYFILNPENEILMKYFPWSFWGFIFLFTVGIGLSIWGNSAKSPEDDLTLKLKNELKSEFVNSIDSIKNQILTLELQMNSNQLKFQLLEQRIPDTTKSPK